MSCRSSREPWSNEPSSRIRVLLECEPEFLPPVFVPALERHGYSVRTCEGPRHRGCDLFDNGACALVDGADVVVNLFHETVTGSRIRDAVTATRRPPAVVTEMTPTQSRTAAGGKTRTPTANMDHITVLRSPVDTKRLITAIQEAVAQQDRPLPIWGDGFC